MTTYYEVDSRSSPFQLEMARTRVMVSGELSDRLEVPEEWQWHESFDARVQKVLWAAAEAIKNQYRANEVATFKVAFPHNLTRQEEELSLSIHFDGDDYLVDFA